MMCNSYRPSSEMRQTQLNFTPNIQDKLTNEKKIYGKPFQSILIGPVNNDINIPRKINSPFAVKPNLWSDNINRILDSYFSNSPSAFFPTKDFQILSFYAISKERDEISEYIAQRIIEYAKIYSQTLTNNYQNNNLFHNECSKIVHSIEAFSPLFEFLQQDISFSDIFFSEFHKNLISNTNFLGVFATEISELVINAFETETAIPPEYKYSFLFLEKCDLLCDAFNTTINQNLKNFYIEVLNNYPEQEDFVPLFKKFHIVYQSIPNEATNILKLLSQSFSVNIIKNNNEAFISNVGHIVINDKAGITTFFAVLDPATPITCYTSFVKNILGTGIDVAKMAQLHKFIGKQSTHMRHILERFLKKRLLNHEKEASIALAKIFDDNFRNNIYDEDSITLLSLIQDKSSFESAHSCFFMRRLIDLNISTNGDIQNINNNDINNNLTNNNLNHNSSNNCDRTFANDHLKFYDDNHSRHFQLLIKDGDDSKNLFKEFQKVHQIPSFLTIHTFFWQNWYTSNKPVYKFPVSLTDHLSTFTLYFREKMPKRRLEWRLDASDCELTVFNKSVKCNGVTGTALLALNSGPKDPSEVTETTEIPSEEVFGILSQFTDEKGHNILKKVGDKFAINNESLGTENTTLVLPLRTPEEKVKQKFIPTVLNIMSANAIIDGLIMTTLKREREMTKSQILKKTQELLTFPASKETIKDRINRLERCNFISHDPMNAKLFHYVP
ncbi:hypothetical protein TRFO_12360 [Tritrichomonas foetus]|uniref:Cullin family profile domain-containing protein n=1 Tax=Tritrichomonas foetus TaxID=1144522 RepID=A0A1J4L630_9EUKA|nr:hypothetical protein TRFO_12360 [Tritrichomonas foetus]|eukprot:OHT17406.1 hypothetical protein TRFO_12360 [Tritrichomonas foetus]